MTLSPHPPTDGAPGWWQQLARRAVGSRADVVLLLLDVALVGAAYLAILLARFDLAVPTWAWDGLRLFLPLAIVVHLAANGLARLYGPVWEQASVFEARKVLSAGAIATAVLTGAMLVLPRLVPLSVVIVGGGLATALFGALRFHSRLFAFRRHARPDGARVLMIGAGNAAGALLREIARHDDVSIRPVAILDDDVVKYGRRLGGIPIVGGIDGLVEVGRDLDIDQVLLAIPSATSELVRRVADATAELEVPLKVLPSVDEHLNGQPRLRDVRDLSIDDLLGRQQVKTDLASVEAMVRGRRVVVTGGGGSIGAEIARQLAGYEPARLVLVDHDETHLFDASATIDDCAEVLLDIRDRRNVDALFEQEAPEIVFHAAANKHVPLLESYPCEAVATNVLGTQNIVRAALAVGVDHLVFISTDKAVNPSSVMGASKSVGEQLVLTAAPPGSAWCAVRFGNVLGSRGSVVPTFVRQIRQGGPVTVTHPDVTRYFMSIPEAVQLVLQAAALAQDREVFMLDMGEPVRIVDLANRMISLAGYRAGVDMRIEVTGLRPGEKLEEELNSDDEHPVATSHPKILQLHPRLLGPADVRHAVLRLAHAVEQRDDHKARELLWETAYRGASVIRLPEAQARTPGREHV